MLKVPNSLIYVSKWFLCCESTYLKRSLYFCILITFFCFFLFWFHNWFLFAKIRLELKDTGLLDAVIGNLLLKDIDLNEHSPALISYSLFILRNWFYFYSSGFWALSGILLFFSFKWNWGVFMYFIFSFLKFSRLLPLDEFELFYWSKLNFLYEVFWWWFWSVA